jgi:RNA polymerase sigma factor FliA
MFGGLGIPDLVAVVWNWNSGDEMPLLEASGAQAPTNREERDSLVMSQLTEVQFIARRIHERLPVFIPLEDLVHSGVLGLLEATQKYDSTRNVQFKTFAQFRIRGAILDSLRKLDSASRRLRTKGRKVNAALAQLSMKLGRQPTEEEVAQEVGLDLDDLRKLVRTLRSVESVDHQVSFGRDRAENRDLIESAPADAEESPFALCLRSEMRQHLTEAISSLAPREKQIVALYYVEQLTMQEIATILNVKSSRISQIHSAAIAKLRTYLEAKEIGEEAELRGASGPRRM